MIPNPIRAIRHPHRVLPRGAQRAVRDGDAVGGALAGEVPALHHAGEALALADPADVDLLPRDKVLREDGRAFMKR